LNQFHDVRRWLKDEQRFKLYKDVDIRWIQGANPDLLILDDNGRERERIDLTTLNYDELTSMMEEKGFKTHDEL
jgi:hypothetical protein